MDKSGPPPPMGFQTGAPPPPPYQAHPPPPQSAFQPPPPTFQPPQPSIIIVGTAFGPEPQHMTCPHCHSNISTAVETEANSKTHMFALLLCLFGLWCCAPCPYCIDSCMVKKHYCPNCRAYLGQSDN